MKVKALLASSGDGTRRTIPQGAGVVGLGVVVGGGVVVSGGAVDGAGVVVSGTVVIGSVVGTIGLDSSVTKR